MLKAIKLTGAILLLATLGACSSVQTEEEVAIENALSFHFNDQESLYRICSFSADLTNAKTGRAIPTQKGKDNMYLTTPEEINSRYELLHSEYDPYLGSPLVNRLRDRIVALSNLRFHGQGIPVNYYYDVAFKRSSISLIGSLTADLKSEVDEHGHYLYHLPVKDGTRTIEILSKEPFSDPREMNFDLYSAEFDSQKPNTCILYAFYRKHLDEHDHTLIKEDPNHRPSQQVEESKY